MTALKPDKRQRIKRYTDIQPVVMPEKREILFTCLRCKQNYVMEVEVDQCPVCDWRRKPSRISDE